MSIAREEDNEIARRNFKKNLRGVIVQFYILALIVLFAHALAVLLRLPAHRFAVGQRQLDINIVAVCLHRQVFLVLALQVNDVDEEVVSVQTNFASRKDFQVVVVKELHKSLQTGNDIVIKVGVF